jgi:hypothetical protein
MSQRRKRDQGLFDIFNGVFELPRREIPFWIFLSIFLEKLFDTNFWHFFWVVFLNSHRRETPKNAIRKSRGKLALNKAFGSLSFFRKKFSTCNFYKNILMAFLNSPSIPRNAQNSPHLLLFDPTSQIDESQVVTPAAYVLCPLSRTPRSPPGKLGPSSSAGRDV